MTVEQRLEGALGLAQPITGERLKAGARLEAPIQARGSVGGTKCFKGRTGDGDMSEVGVGKQSGGGGDFFSVWSEEPSQSSEQGSDMMSHIW